MTSRSWSGGSEAIAVALTFALAVTLFTLGGRWLDGQLVTSPLFLILGAALGVLGGFLHVLSRLAPDLLPFGRRGPKPPAESPRESSTPSPADSDED